jgi:hypothetical protein
MKEWKACQPLSLNKPKIISRKNIMWRLVRKETIALKRLPLVGEVSANFGGKRVMSCQRKGSPRPLISFF